MTADIEYKKGAHWNLWRTVGWSIAVALILTPLVAMQFTPEVQWTGSDFVFAIVLIGGIGLLLETVFRMARNGYYRAGAVLALLGSFLIIWVNGAVGMIGDEGDPVNLLFGIVILVALAGAILARFRSRGMAVSMFAAGAVQAAISSIGIMGADMRGGLFALMLSGIWVLSGTLFIAATDRS